LVNARADVADVPAVFVSCNVMQAAVSPAGASYTGAGCLCQLQAAGITLHQHSMLGAHPLVLVWQVQRALSLHSCACMHVSVTWFLPKAHQCRASQAHQTPLRDKWQIIFKDLHVQALHLPKEQQGFDWSHNVCIQPLHITNTLHTGLCVNQTLL
jgi:hypothetical protein